MSETAAAALLDGHRLYQGFCDGCGRTEAHCTARVILAERDRLREGITALIELALDDNPGDLREILQIRTSLPWDHIEPLLALLAVEES